MKLKVVEITPETSDAITIHFEHPEKLTINYKPGQFLTLIMPINGVSVRRAYSLCSTPYEAPRLAVTVKRVPGGLVSNHLLDNLKAGELMDVMEPIGNFNLVTNPGLNRSVVLIGAGIGITPLMSILKAVLKEEPQSRVTLIYGNRNEDSVIFKNQLEKLESDYTGRLVVQHVFSQPNNQAVPHSGRLNRSTVLKVLEKHNLPLTESQYYICGPEVKSKVEEKKKG